MKTISTLIIILLIGLSDLLAQNGNLLDPFNGDFEDGLDRWRFFEVPANIGSRAEVVTSDAAQGGKAVKIVFVPDDGSVADRGFDNFDTNVPVIGGENYTASVQAKASGGANLHLWMTLGYFDHDRNVIDEISTGFPLSGSYQTFSLQREAPAAAAICWIAFRLFDGNNNRIGGTLFLDDARITGKRPAQIVLVPRVMATRLPSDDVPIASIDITEAPFGAKSDGSADAATALQTAIDFAAASGGAVIFIPAGRYRFDGGLLLREKVILRGDWQNPAAGSSEKGTVLMPYGGQGDASGQPFIRMERGSGIKNMTIWYPNQRASSVSPYPWTIQCNPPTAAGPGDNTSIINVTLVNPYQAIKVGPDWNELHYIRNVYGAPLKTGIWVSQTTDIGRIMNVHFAAKYWSQSGLENSPAEAQITAWLQQNAEGIVMGRSDWEYMYDVSLTGYKVGVHIFKYSDMGPNGVIYGLHTEKGETGIQFDNVNGIGFSVTGSVINASAGDQPVCVAVGDEFESVVQFNSCTFGGSPKNNILFSANSTGMLTFQNCRFEDWGYPAGGAAIESNAGSLAVLACDFVQDKLHVRLGNKVKSVRILDSQFPDSIKLENKSRGEVLVAPESLDLPRLTAPAHPFAAEPRPATNDLFVAQDFGAVGDGRTDDTEAFQNALNAAGQNGGGTMYVPGGWYRIAAHLSVPAGVELRGIWDVPHHTISRGTVLLAYEGKGNAGAAPFISLQPGSGVRGLTVWYPEQNSADIQAFPWSIQAQGANCWIKDVTLGNPYLGVDLASFPCSNHYVSYLAGSPLKTGIYVSNNPGQGWVENVQFNPHYWLRSSGYPKMSEPDFNQVISFQQRELTAFRFGVCQMEHVLGTFVYAANEGLYFSNDGGECHADVFLHGTDAGSYGVRFGCDSGSELNLVNTQLVTLGANIRGIITTDEGFSGKAAIFNTLTWGDNNSLTADIRGSGDVTIQQLHTGNHHFEINGGVNRLQNIVISQKFDPQYRIGSNVKRVDLFGNYAADGFKMKNEAGGKVEADYNFKQGSQGIKLKTGWEEGEKQSDWENTLYSLKNIEPFPGEAAPKCAVQSLDSAHTGKTALFVSGRDNSAVESYVYFKVISYRIPVFGSTLLQYWLNPGDEPGRNIHFDILFTDGSRLTDFQPVADDSLPLISPRGKIGRWSEVTVRMGKYAQGKTTQTILVGYNYGVGQGNFSAYLDDVSIFTPENLPTPWQESDVGAVQPEGYTIFDEGKFRVKGGGLGL